MLAYTQKSHGVAYNMLDIGEGDLRARQNIRTRANSFVTSWFQSRRYEKTSHRVDCSNITVADSYEAKYPRKLYAETSI